MMNQVRTCFQLLSSGIAIILCAGFAVAQEQPGPQAPAPVASTDTPPASAHSQPASSGERLMGPSGTRLPLILHNAVTTRNAGPGDAIYLETTFPITQNSRILIPAGSYVQGEILEAKRPGKVKGRGEVRIRMTTLIFPNGYTVNLNAVPHNAGTGGNESADNEGKIKGDSA